MQRTQGSKWSVSYIVCVKRVRLAIVIVMSFATLAVLSQFTYWGYRSPGFRSPDCDAPLVNHVKRKYFPLRHWPWSGIPVLEGGFIPDPHYICSTVVSVAEPVKEKLGSKDGEYAVIDVNPFFNDGTSEVLLLIQANGSKFEYSLSIPKGQNVQAVIASPTAPEAMLFPSGNDLVVLANFFGPAKGMYRLPLPLGHSGKLQFIPAKAKSSQR